MNVIQTLHKHSLLSLEEIKGKTQAKTMLQVKIMVLLRQDFIMKADHIFLYK